MLESNANNIRNIVFAAISTIIIILFLKLFVSNNSSVQCLVKNSRYDALPQNGYKIELFTSKTIPKI